MAHWIRPARRGPLTVTIAAVVALAVGIAVLARSPEAPPASSPVAITSSIAPSTSVSASTGLATGSASPSAAPSSAPASAPPSLAAVLPVVPIVGFWSTIRSLSVEQLGAALGGRDRRFRLVVVGGPDLAALEAALRVTAGPKVRQLTPKAAIAAVQGHRDVLGFVPAGDVGPSVRALAVGGRSLFANARVRSLGEWPLTVPAMAGVAAPPAFDPAATWTLVAAGDVMNDREVYRRAVLLGHGPEYPWDGGTARIVRRTCCSAGEPIVQATRTGHAGAVRALFKDADLAIVNHEGPSPDDFTYHPSLNGLTFTFDPRLEAGIANAGVDVVSLANNHIRNAGSDGVIQTIRAVRASGVVPVGAGANASAARQPAWFTVGGIRVAILAYDAINLGSAGATTTRAGAAPLDLAHCRADIRAARAAGADVVVVLPHWGVEYTSRPTPAQRRQAAALNDAGADLILGSHTHWAGPVEAIGDGLVVYSMGDFIFDLPRSEQAEEGLIVELTFVGKRLAQVDIHPTMELDRSQPNLLDPARDGRVVLDRVRDASRTFLDW